MIDKDWDPRNKATARLIVGNQRGTWPLRLFSNEAHALHWVQEDPDTRQVWEVEVHIVHELCYVPPGKGSLIPGDKPKITRVASA